MLSAQPEASVEYIARGAGVTRQTVYAHFPWPREALLDAVVERAAAEVTAAFEAAGLDEAPPAVALTRLLDAGWQAAARYPFLWHLPAVSPDQDACLHCPESSARCWRSSGAGRTAATSRRTLSPGWLLAASLALGRAAEEQVKAGQMTIDEATHAVHHSFLRLLGVHDPRPRC